jgi:hypothetical protein
MSHLTSTGRFNYALFIYALFNYASTEELSNTYYYCRLTRKGTNRSALSWMRRVGSYVAEWETATTRVWQEDLVFDPDLFNSYLQIYMTSTRIRITYVEHPELTPAPTTWDMYPTQSTAGSRQYAVRD